MTDMSINPAVVEKAARAIARCGGEQDYSPHEEHLASTALAASGLVEEVARLREARNRAEMRTSQLATSCDAYRNERDVARAEVTRLLRMQWLRDHAVNADPGAGVTAERVESVAQRVIALNCGPNWENDPKAYQFSRGTLAGIAAILEDLDIAQPAADVTDAADAASTDDEPDTTTAAPVDPQWIKDQREQGWPDMHPEDYCHRCGAPNPLWCTDAQTWFTATSRLADTPAGG